MIPLSRFQPQVARSIMYDFGGGNLWEDEAEVKAKLAAIRRQEERHRQRKSQLQECLKRVTDSQAGRLVGASNAFSLANSERLRRYADFFRDVFKKSVLPALLGKGMRLDNLHLRESKKEKKKKEQKQTEANLIYINYLI